MYKQLIIIRKDLLMSTGKIAAQASHAAMAFLTHMIRDNEVGEVLNVGLNPTNKIRIKTFDIDKDLYDQWLNGSFTKVVCQAKNRNQLLKAKTMAEEMGMIEDKDFWLIKDECRTELEPEEIGEDGIGRTLTCIGFKPMDEETISKISKKFQLYK